MGAPERFGDLALALMTTRPEFNAGYECGLRDGMPIGRHLLLEEQDDLALGAARGGIELTYAQVLEQLGEAARAQRVLQAVEEGRQEFMRAARRISSLQPYSDLADRRGQRQRAERARENERWVMGG